MLICSTFCSERPNLIPDAWTHINGVLKAACRHTKTHRKSGNCVEGHCETPRGRRDGYAKIYTQSFREIRPDAAFQLADNQPAGAINH